MRIVNNKIYIVKGETPTYSASIVDKDTGAPFVVDKGIYAEKKDGTKVNTLILEFVVRDSAYSRNDDFRMKYNLLIEEDENFHVFDSTEIIPYKNLTGLDFNDEWNDDNVPDEGTTNNLYYRIDSLDEKAYYAYYKDGHWTDYSFDFDITFQYDKTSKMEPKTYKYEIALLGGSLKENPTGKETIVNVVYKKPILDLTDFIVEGSVSE